MLDGFDSSAVLGGLEPLEPAALGGFDSFPEPAALGGLEPAALGGFDPLEPVAVEALDWEAVVCLEVGLAAGDRSGVVRLELFASAVEALDRFGVVCWDSCDFFVELAEEFLLPPGFGSPTLASNCCRKNDVVVKKVLSTTRFCLPSLPLALWLLPLYQSLVVS